MHYLSHPNEIFDLMESNQIYFVRERETTSCENQQKSEAAPKGQWSLIAITVTVRTTSMKRTLDPLQCTLRALNDYTNLKPLSCSPNIVIMAIKLP